jgi:hypothetical protein
MPYLKGALIEYGSDFIGPVPNIVIFQFNPETVSRTIQIPTRTANSSATSSASVESNQAGDSPLEKINFTANFSAADQLNDNNVLARAVGIGPQIAALEKMVFPGGKISGLLGAAIDAIGDALGLGGKGEEGPEKPIPRQKYPRILFIWGLTRILPVIIDSMSITEQQYDSLLNPIQAEVAIGLSVTPIDDCSDDKVGKGAYDYSSMAKEALAMSNLVNTAGQITDLIPF